MRRNTPAPPPSSDAPPLRPHRKHRRVLPALVGLTVSLAALHGPLPAAHAETFFSAGTASGGFPTGYDDAINDPLDLWRWTTVTITYKFDPTFLADFPNPGVADQVRLAFATWNNQLTTPYGSVYSYGRALGAQPFGDIRSVALHEIGHIVGLGHPDAGAAVSRNYRPDGMGGLMVASDSGDEVMRSWINPGDYNHVFSWDELDGYRHSYGATQLVFTEVPSSMPADIVVRTANNGSPGNWAIGLPAGPFNDPSNQALGLTVTSGTITFNDATDPTTPLGYETLACNWDVTNSSGQPVHAMIIQTHGTNNPTPVSHYDNDGPNQFLAFSGTDAGADLKDDRIWTWSNPNGGDIPAGQLLHVGLTQDVWDWTVVSAQVEDPGGALTSAPIVISHPVAITTVVQGTAAVRGPMVPRDAALAVQDDLDRRGKQEVLAHGFVLTTQNVIDTVASNLIIADVTGMRLGLAQLTRRELSRLQDAQKTIPIEKFGTRTLKAGGDFYVILQGKAQDLPAAVQKQGNFLILNRPDLVGRELFVALQSQDDKGQITDGNFALIGTPPVATAPTLHQESGLVTLDNYQGDITKLPITIDICRTDATGENKGRRVLVESHDVLLNQDGGFSFETALSGSYDLTAKSTHWLRGLLPAVHMGDGSVRKFSLTNGDINGDNVVNLGDFSKFRRAFGGSDPSADLNGDGTVNLADFTILRRAFGLSGAEEQGQIVVAPGATVAESGEGAPITGLASANPAIVSVKASDAGPFSYILTGKSVGGPVVVTITYDDGTTQRVYVSVSL